jgi:diacylglycerol kinase family enzyme
MVPSLTRVFYGETTATRIRFIRRESERRVDANVCVIFNPNAGKGQARAALDRLRKRLGRNTAFWPTAAAGHAEELARKAALDGFATVAAAGGDGTVHEVANGLIGSGRADVILGIYPIGSANDYAFALGLAPGWWERPDVETAVRPVDVGRVRSGSRQRYFINGIGIGFNGMVTLEARRIRWLRGVPLYALALIRALLFRFQTPRMRVTMNGREKEMPTLALSVNLGQREGNFLVTPRAVLDDGQFDFLHAGPVRRWELIRYLPAMVTGKLPQDHPRFWTGRCREVRLRSEAPLTAHLDGEFFCQAHDNVRDLEIMLLPAGLRVLGAKNVG